MAQFTPEEVQEILDAFFETMGTRQYIGARYVPIFGRRGETSAEWDDTAPYEPLTIVLHGGDSYTSRQFVPTGVSIENRDFWVRTGNFNGQLAQIQQTIDGYNARIAAAEAKADTAAATATQAAADVATEVTAREDADAALEVLITAEETARTSADSTLEQAIEDEETARTTADATLQSAINAEQSARIAADVALQTAIDEKASVLPRPKNVVVIGDSYGRGVGGNDHGWPYYFQQYLQPSYMLNVSNSGAGFVSPGHSDPYGAITYNGQVNWAAEHLADGITADMIDHVIIGGGYNDHDDSGIYDAAQACVRNARAKFPNAKIFFFPMAVPKGLDSQFHAAYMNMCYGCAVGGAAVSNQAIYWLLAKNSSTVMNSDNIHPTEDGYKIIARNLCAEVCGGTMIAEAASYGSSADGFALRDATSNGFRCGVNQGMAWMVGGLNVSSPAANHHLATLPWYLRPIAASRYFIAIGYGTSGAPIALRLRLSTDGTFDLQSAVSPGDASLLSGVTTVYIQPFCMPLNVM